MSRLIKRIVISAARRTENLLFARWWGDIPPNSRKGEKQGFSAPDASWFKGESIDYVAPEIVNPGAPIYNFMDYSSTTALVDDHLSGREEKTDVCWSGRCWVSIGGLRFHVLSAFFCVEINPIWNLSMKSLFSFSLNIRAFRSIVKFLIRHRHLVWEMAKREIYDRYAGQFLGIFWAIGHPLVLMSVYVVIFGFVFKVNVANNLGVGMGYTIYLLSGLIPWLAFQESMSKASSVIIGNSNLVKPVVSDRGTSN